MKRSAEELDSEHSKFELQLRERFLLTIFDFLCKTDGTCNKKVVSARLFNSAPFYAHFRALYMYLSARLFECTHFKAYAYLSARLFERMHI